MVFLVLSLVPLRLIKEFVQKARHWAVAVQYWAHYQFTGLTHARVRRTLCVVQSNSLCGMIWWVLKWTEYLQNLFHPNSITSLRENPSIPKRRVTSSTFPHGLHGIFANTGLQWCTKDQATHERLISAHEKPFSWVIKIPPTMVLILIARSYNPINLIRQLWALQNRISSISCRGISVGDVRLLHEMMMFLTKHLPKMIAPECFHHCSHQMNPSPQARTWGKKTTPR